MLSDHSPNETPPYSLGDQMTQEAFINKKMAAVARRLAELRQERDRDNTKKIEELAEYQDQLTTELQRLNRKTAEIQAQANRPLFTFVTVTLFTPAKNFFLKLSDEAGLISAAMNIFYNAIRATTDYFLRVFATPLYLAAAAAYALEDIYHILNDDQIQQRKTRFITNIATIGLFGLGLAVTLGALASFIVTPIALPVVMWGVLGAAYYKNAYIHHRTNEAIEKIHEKTAKIQTELHQTIHALFASPSSQELRNALNLYRLNSTHLTASNRVFSDLSKKIILECICRDPNIQRLAFQRNDYQLQLRRLEIQRDHADKNKKGSAGMIVGIGIMMLGLAFPPAALPLAIIGGLIFVTASTAFKNKISDAKLKKLDNLIENQSNMHSQREYIHTFCETRLQSLPQLSPQILAALTTEANLSHTPNSEFKAATISTPTAVIKKLAANNHTEAKTYAVAVHSATEAAATTTAPQKADIDLNPVAAALPDYTNSNRQNIPAFSLTG